MKNKIDYFKKLTKFIGEYSYKFDDTFSKILKECASDSSAAAFILDLEKLPPPKDIRYVEAGYTSGKDYFWIHFHDAHWFDGYSSSYDNSRWAELPLTACAGKLLEAAIKDLEEIAFKKAEKKYLEIEAEKRRKNIFNFMTNQLESL